MTASEIDLDDFFVARGRRIGRRACCIAAANGQRDLVGRRALIGSFIATPNA